MRILSYFVFAVTVLVQSFLFGQQPVRKVLTPVPRPVVQTPIPRQPVAPASAEQQSPVPAANPAPTSVADTEIAEEIKKAIEKFNDADFNGAFDLLKAIYDKHPEQPPPRITMAQWFAQADLGEAVRVSLEMATEETYEDPEAYILLGEIALRQQYLTSAELLMRQAAELLGHYDANPERKKAMRNALLKGLVGLSEARGRWNDMETYVDQAIKTSGETAKLCRQKGIALFQQKKDTEAQTCFEKADALETDETRTGLPAEAAMSQLYLARNDNANAGKFLSAALAKYPDSKEVLLLSIQSRLNGNQLDEAKELAEKLVKSHPTFVPGKQLLSTILLYLGDYPAAEKLFRERVLEAPADLQAANGLALALCEQDSPEKKLLALEYARNNVRDDPQNGEFLATLGWGLFQSGHFDQAAKMYKSSIAGGKVNAATAYYMAKLFAQTGKITEAKQLLENAVSSPAPFAKQRDAAALLDELKKRTE